MDDDELKRIAAGMMSLSGDPEAERLVCKFCDLWAPMSEAAEVHEAHHPCKKADRWARGEV